MNSGMTVPRRLEDLQEILDAGNHINFRDTMGYTWTLKDTPKYYKIEADAPDGEVFLFGPLEEAFLFMMTMMVNFNG
jgi:hypothetical protein